MNVSFSHVPHALYILLKLAVRPSLQFFSIPLWASA